MLYPDSRFTKLRWLFTVGGLVMYVLDVGTDVNLGVGYLREGQYVRSGLTLAFVLVGLTATQVFSYVWYADDMRDVLRNPEGTGTVGGMSKGERVAVHLLGMGVLSRYYHLLKKGFRAIWAAAELTTVEERREEHHELFCLATDLSMLKLFEAFLESTPQLLLQLYIVLGGGGCSVMQYISMTFSFVSTAWALLDYRRCLRRSIPQIREMPSGLPTFVYLLYKLCTITSRVLSYCFLLVLSVYGAVGLGLLWLTATVCARLFKTNFCSSRALELLYQAVIGVILTFTFFNVRGQDTQVVMSVYYCVHSIITVTAPLLLLYLKPETQTATFLLPVSVVIYATWFLGLVSLILYYLYLHPRANWREADEVDGLRKETEAVRRIRTFLQP